MHQPLTCTCTHCPVCCLSTCMLFILSIRLHVGIDCVVVKCGQRMCGTGAALANSPLVQDKSYFEVKLQCEGETIQL